jgi:hypothetical protein
MYRSTLVTIFVGVRSFIMESIEMKGPFDLTADSINVQVAELSSGNYVLGNFDCKGIPFIKYTGRSDCDLNTEIKKFIGKYQLFKFLYASSVQEAFEKECKYYHDYGESNELDNKVHPDRPAGTDWLCPICRIFD